MINFILGMIVMYIICGVVLFLDDTVSNGFASDWVMWIFLWYALIFCYCVRTFRKRRKNRKRGK